MTLAAIKEQITELSAKDRLALESWLAERWDAEIENDFSSGGAGMRLLDKVRADVRQGKFEPFPRVRRRS